MSTPRTPVTQIPIVPIQSRHSGGLTPSTEGGVNHHPGLVRSSFRAGGRGAKQLAAALSSPSISQTTAGGSRVPASPSTPKRVISDAVYTSPYGNSPLALTLGHLLHSPVETGPGDYAEGRFALLRSRVRACFVKIITCTEESEASGLLIVQPFRTHPHDARRLVPWEDTLWTAMRSHLYMVKLRHATGGATGYFVEMDATIDRYMQRVQQRVKHSIKFPEVLTTEESKEKPDQMIQLEDSSDDDGITVSQSLPASQEEQHVPNNEFDVTRAVPILLPSLLSYKPTTSSTIRPTENLLNKSLSTANQPNLHNTTSISSSRSSSSSTCSTPIQLLKSSRRPHERMMSLPSPHRSNLGRLLQPSSSYLRLKGVVDDLSAGDGGLQFLSTSLFPGSRSASNSQPPGPPNNGSNIQAPSISSSASRVLAEDLIHDMIPSSTSIETSESSSTSLFKRVIGGEEVFPPKKKKCITREEFEVPKSLVSNPEATQQSLDTTVSITQ